MYDYYLTSFVIIPHGITDLTQISIRQLPILLITYLFGLLSCTGFHEFISYGHIGFFLCMSVLHFYQDFIYLNIRPILSLLGGTSIVGVPSLLLYYDQLILAKYFMVWYMIFYHVPMHYSRVKANRKDIAGILLITFVSGIIGPSILKEIETNGANDLYSVMGCGMVSGHVLWNYPR